MLAWWRTHIQLAPHDSVRRLKEIKHCTREWWFWFCRGFFQKMSRYQFLTKVNPHYTNASDTIMDRFLFGKYCDVFPDNNISEELSNVCTHPERWLL